LRYAISLPSARVNEISAPDAYTQTRENRKPRLYRTRFDDSRLCGYGGLLIELWQRRCPERLAQALHLSVWIFEP